MQQLTKDSFETLGVWEVDREESMEIETWSETSCIQTLYILFQDSDNLALF